jgi:hypothetical protein
MSESEFGWEMICASRQKTPCVRLQRGVERRGYHMCGREQDVQKAVCTLVGLEWRRGLTKMMWTRISSHLWTSALVWYLSTEDTEVEHTVAVNTSASMNTPKKNGHTPQDET